MQQQNHPHQQHVQYRQPQQQIPQQQSQYQQQQNMQQMQYHHQQQQMQYQQVQQQPMQQQYHQQQQYSFSPPVHPTSQLITGPRQKCDQVIYEALVKACEIAVRGRCTDLVDDALNSTTMGTAGGHNNQKRRSWNYGGNTDKSSGSGGGGSSGGGNGGGGAGSSSTSSRFNIDIDEVPSIRSTTSSTWKRALHTPLRLDIYYEHEQQQAVLVSQEGQGDVSQPPPPPPPQRELLERWCIDYIPSSYPHSLNNSFTTSLSQSPSSSPYSSPYSSRIMMSDAISGGAGAGGGGGSSMSQLRQVCKRIVVLLRNLHCMTRMLPAYRLKCLLAEQKGMGMMPQGAQFMNMGAAAAAANSINDSSIGWGTIGYSIHMADYPSDPTEPPSLPSPSFARQSLPSVSTPYGNLCMSVMYDATLHPNHMMADLAEERSRIIQQRSVMLGAGLGGRHQDPYGQYGQQYSQQLQYTQEQQQLLSANNYHLGPNSNAVSSSSTQPIPINAHQMGLGQHQQQHQKHAFDNNLGGGARNSPAEVQRQQQQLQQQQQATTTSSSYNPTVARREYGSCPPAALRGGHPASLGSLGGGMQHGRSRAVSDFIISDYHNSPNLRSTSASTSASHSPYLRSASHSPRPSPAGQQYQQSLSSSPAISGSGQGQQQQQRVMSGLSLAMMNEEDNTSPVEHVVNTSPHLQQQQHEQQQELDELILQSLGSPVTRAAFHNPPPVYHNLEGYDNNNQLPQLQQQQEEPSFLPSQVATGGGIIATATFVDPATTAATGMNNNNVPLSVSPGVAGGVLSGTPPGQQHLWPRDGTKVIIGSHQQSPGGTMANNNQPYANNPSSTMMTRPSLSRNNSGRMNSGGTANTPPRSSILGISNTRQQYPPPLVNSPNQCHQKAGVLGSGDSSMQQQQQRSASFRHSSSSSMHMLPPITSLDILQKSPFAVARRKVAVGAADAGDVTTGKGANGANNKADLAGSAHGNNINNNTGEEQENSDEMINSSIPKMVSNENNDERNNDGNISSIAVSTLGDGTGSSSASNNNNSSNDNHPLMPSSSSGGAIAFASNTDGSEESESNNAISQGQKEESEELPFAVDVDDNVNANPLLVSSASPSKSRSLWGGSTMNNKADNALNSMIGGGAGGVATSGIGGGGGTASGGGIVTDITSSLAASSLHHRLATDGKIRLKMFESTRTVESVQEGHLDLGSGENNSANNGEGEGDGNPRLDYASIKDQLSDFRSFGASLMVGSGSISAQETDSG